MISTLYFSQFIAFYLWQITSAKRNPDSPLLAKIMANKKASRVLGAVLLLATAIGFVFSLGLLSGLCSFIIGLMGVGCLAVALDPFHYLRLPGLAMIYSCSVALEILI
jgi:hypothetical protein